MGKLIVTAIWFMLLAAPSVLSAQNAGPFVQGEVVDIMKKDKAFKLKNNKGETVTYKVTDDLAKGKTIPSNVYKHSFKDLKVGQMIKMEYTEKGGKKVCIKINIVKKSTTPCPCPP